MANMYVDDTSISYFSNSISTINNFVNEDLELLKTEENKLSLNVAKTNTILMGSRKKQDHLNTITPQCRPSILATTTYLP